jgi:ParB family chromosome partitioning protein
MIRRPDTKVQMIRVDQIDVVNGRTRGKAKFKQIVDNISRIGLKKPITVARRETRSGETRYDLVCGEGRLNAYKALGQEVVPAIVVEASKEDLLLMSLVENLARKRHTGLELAKEIVAMKERGADFQEIASKTDLDVTYVRGIVRLLKKGEERLLQAVERGQIPISTAITIACSDDAAVQRALTEAYENKSLRGKSLLKARRLIEERSSRGKALRRGSNGNGGNGNGNGDGHGISADKLIRAFHVETNKQRLLVRKAKMCETRLLFIVSALRSMFEEADFVALLRAE